MSKAKEMIKGSDISVEERLRYLYKLQKIDSKIDEIHILKGELPIEVLDLEDEVTGLKTRVAKYDDEINDLETIIANKKVGQKESEGLIKKYQKQQNNVKNNREFEALSKEMEMQKLEIQLDDKRIREANAQIDYKKTSVAECEKTIKTREKELKQKKADLDNIIEETEAEEKALLKKSKDASSKIEGRLYNAYHKIRTNYKNGLGLVTVQRGSCGGCFNAIPPQQQMEIRQHKKIILCEHCGRILVDEVLGN